MLLPTCQRSKSADDRGSLPDGRHIFVNDTIQDRLQPQGLIYIAAARMYSIRDVTCNKRQLSAICAFNSCTRQTACSRRVVYDFHERFTPAVKCFASRTSKKRRRTAIPGVRWRSNFSRQIYILMRHRRLCTSGGSIIKYCGCWAGHG